MNTKKKFYISVSAAVYGFVGAILYPTFMGIVEGFDAAVPDEALAIIVIDLLIGIVGVIAAIVYARAMSAEKINQLAGEITQAVCKNCKTNVEPGTEICPRCGNEIK